MPSFDVHHAAGVLHCACDEQKPVAGNDQAVALKDIRCQNDIGDAGFVFKGEEDKAFGGSGALAGR